MMNGARRLFSESRNRNSRINGPKPRMFCEGIRKLIAWTSKYAGKRPGASGLVSGEEPLRFDRGHAARARGGDGLPVVVILYVARREDTRDIRLGSVMGEEVAIGVHIELAFEHFGIGVVADRHENTGSFQLLSFSGFNIAQTYFLDIVFVHVVDFVDDIRRHEPNLLISARPVEHDLCGAEFIAAMEQSDGPGKLGKEGGFFHGRVAATHHYDVLPAEKESVAGRASGYSVPEQVFFRLDPEHA